VALTVTDNNGNSSSCNATVTVEDQVAPQTNCQGMTVQLNNNGTATITAADIDNNSSDVCGIASASLDQTSFDCANVGANTVALTVTDNNGNSSSCNATVTVEDKVAPQANCQGMTVQLNNNGTATITAADIDNNSSDACGIASASLDKVSFDCADIGTNTVALTVTDNNGNSSSCNATVTVEDKVAPQANCQGMTVQLNNNGTATITAADIDNNSSDACGIASVSLDKVSFDCANVGANIVSLTVTDNYGNGSSCNATVTVEDNTAPDALCQDITVQLGPAGAGSTNGQAVDNGSTDACGIQSLVLSQTSFDCSEVGNNAETLTVTDVNGNVSTCSTTVTVQDNVAPNALCQDVTVQLSPTGAASTTVQAVDNGSSDACGIQSLVLSQTDFDCSEVEDNTVTLTVTDVNGNTASCTSMVTIEDNTAPTAVCLSTTVEIQPDGLYHLQESDVYDAASSGDNCAIASVSFPATTFSCDDLDLSFPITVTVEDPSGNTDNCVATIMVVLGDALPSDWTSNTIGNHPHGADQSFDPCATPDPDDGEFNITGSGANGANPTADAVAFSSQNICGDFTITAKVESVTPGGYGGIMVRETNDPGSKQFSLFSNLTNILLVQIRTVANAPKQQQLHSRPFPTWLRVQRTGPWLMAYYSADGINFQYVQAVFLPLNSCLEVGLAAFTNFGGPSTAVFSNVSVTGGNALAGSGAPSFVQQSEQLANSDLQLTNSPKLFPNPTSDVFTLAFPQKLDGEATATLRNQIGQVITQRQLKPGDVTTEWNMSDLPSGLYFMEVRQEGRKPQVLRVAKAE
jgi:regulation of enolase protein 1 (concanavalin A-like superfamily)